MIRDGHKTILSRNFGLFERDKEGKQNDLSRSSGYGESHFAPARRSRSQKGQIAAKIVLRPSQEKKKNICSRCGLCRETCEFFKLVRHESVSPRGKAILKDKEKLAELFYTHCTVCTACRIICPLGYDLEIESIRRKMVERGLETEANKEMIANVRKYGNPFGKIKAGEMPDKLYCC